MSLRAIVAVGSTLAGLVTVHALLNLRGLPRPAGGSAERVDEPVSEAVGEPVSILIPARDEVTTIGTAIETALAQRGIDDLEVLVLDDASHDGTGAVIDAFAAHEDRLRPLHERDDPPTGWLGKPWACARLADAARGSILVFVDADVRLEPDAIASVAHFLRAHSLALVAPYPHQQAGTWLERLTQPLVTWAPVALLPLRWQQHSTRPSLSAANGQLMVIDAGAYRAAGGHAAVRDRVVEDVALMSALRRNGSPAWTVDGSALATCRMYSGTRAVVDGYGKSLWAAFGGPLGSIAVTGVLTLAFVVPAAAALLARDRSIRTIGLAGYALAVAGRALVARRTGEPVRDAWAHPASILAFVALSVVSWWRHLRGTTTWKGRAVVPAGPAAR